MFHVNTPGPIGLILYLGVPDKIILKIIFPKVKFNLFVFYGFTQTKKLVGDLKNIYFPYFGHFYDQSVMADTLGIFSFLVIIYMKHILNHILMVYLSACMWFHRSNSLRPLKNLNFNLFFNILIFVPFSVSAITFHEFCAENILFSKKDYL